MLSLGLYSSRTWGIFGTGINCNPKTHKTIKGKEEKFYNQGSVCKGVGYSDNPHRMCLLGLNNTHIFLTCFECNHKRPAKKSIHGKKNDLKIFKRNEGEWGDACFMCHRYINISVV